MNPLEQYRKEHGLTFRKLAQITGVGPSTVYRHLRGLQTIAPEVAFRYRNALGIPLHELRPDLWPAPEPKGEQEVTDGTA